MSRLLLALVILGSLTTLSGQVYAGSYPPPLVKYPAGFWRSIDSARADLTRTISGYEPTAGYVAGSDIYLQVGEMAILQRYGGVSATGWVDKVVVNGTFSLHNKSNILVPAHDFIYYVSDVPFTAHTLAIPALTITMVNYEAILDGSYAGRVLAVKLPSPEGAQRSTNKVPVSPNVWVNDTVSYRDTRGNLAQTMHGVGEPFSGTDTVECTREGTFTLSYEVRIPDTGQRAVARIIVHCSAI